jgi:hypothetical protein
MLINVLSNTDLADMAKNDSIKKRFSIQKRKGVLKAKANEKVK